jgi:hemerythrin-like metal-binding protein
MLTLPEPLLTGVDIVDQEHAVLVDLAGQLGRLCDRMESRCADCAAARIAQCDQALTEFMKNLLDYMLAHFRHEEAYMEMIGMPPAQLAAHCEEHANISERIMGLVDRNPCRIIAIPADLHDTISAWLTEHIGLWGRQIIDHLAREPLADAAGHAASDAARQPGYIS